MRERPEPKPPCCCPGCEALDRELDAHLARIHDGTATPADRERIERIARRADTPHRVAGKSP